MENRKIHICGAGGIGFWLVVGLARSNYPVTVYDDDNLSGGLGHTRLPTAAPTTRKVDLLKGFLRVNFGGVMPTFVPERFSGSEVGRGDLVVDCSDMATNTRRIIWTKAKKRGARLLRVSYDGANSTVVVAEGLPFVKDERAAGYANVPSLALSLAAGGLGAEVVLRMLEGDLNTEYTEFQISVADFTKIRDGEGRDDSVQTQALTV